MKHDTFLKKIESFLLKKKTISVGGWPEVNSEELKTFERIVRDLICYKWDADASMDFPVDIVVIDRTKYSYMPYVPIRHFHQLKNEKDKIEALKMAKYNASIAFAELNKMLDIMYNKT